MTIPGLIRKVWITNRDSYWKPCPWPLTKGLQNKLRGHLALQSQRKGCWSICNLYCKGQDIFQDKVRISCRGSSESGQLSPLCPKQTWTCWHPMDDWLNTPYSKVRGVRCRSERGKWKGFKAQRTLDGKRLSRDQGKQRISLPLDKREHFTASFVRQRMKNQLLWRSLYIVWMWIPSRLIFKITSSFEKKMNWRDLCVDSILKSLIAGIIKVPIRLYWSLTSKDASFKKRLLGSLFCRYLWCL